MHDCSHNDSLLTSPDAAMALHHLASSENSLCEPGNDAFLLGGKVAATGPYSSDAPYEGNGAAASAACSNCFDTHALYNVLPDISAEPSAHRTSSSDERFDSVGLPSLAPYFGAFAFFSSNASLSESGSSSSQLNAQLLHAPVSHDGYSDPMASFAKVEHIRLNIDNAGPDPTEIGPLVGGAAKRQRLG